MEKINLITDIDYVDVSVLDPVGDRILDNGTGNSDKNGNFWFESFKVFPTSNKQYIVNATIKSTGLPFHRLLTCVKGNTTSSFKQ